MAGKKIGELTPLGRDLISTDELELSLAGSAGSRKITGQEIMNTSKLNIGTTAITSGTVGRVLFEGTGNVVQESANLFWDNTNGRLGIGGTPSTYNLDVVGTARVQDNVTVQKNQNLLTSIDLTNTTSGANSYTQFSAISDVNSGANSFGKYSTLKTAYKIIQPRDSYYYNGSIAGDFAILNDCSSGKIKFAAGGSSTAQMTLFSTGNFAINTTTDAGFRLDVNGTARVSDNLLLTNGIIATSTGTTRLQGSLNYFTHNRLGSSGALGFQISQTGTLSSFWRWTDATNDVEFGNARNAALSLFTNNTVKATITGGGNVLINTTTDAGYKLDVNGTARLNTLTIGLGGGQVSSNTAIGLQALNGNTTGARNVGLGQQSNFTNSTGVDNTAIGHSALFSNTANHNTAVGSQALYTNTGNHNSAFGRNAMISNSSGAQNTGIGRDALSANTTGSDNSALGYQTDSGNFSGSTILGRGATATANNQFVVGSTGTVAGAVTSEVNASTQVWNVVINGVARKILLA